MREREKAIGRERDRAKVRRIGMKCELKEKSAARRQLAVCGF